MNLDKLMEVAGIPALIAAICVYYGIRLLITKDSTLIRGKKAGAIKDEKGYCQSAAYLLFYFAVVNLIFGALLFWNTYVAVGVIVAGTVVLCILWMRMSKRLG